MARHRLRKLELRTAVTGAESLLVIVEQYGPTDPAVDADIAALKEAGLLRGSAVRMICVLDGGKLEGLKEDEERFLADRRKTA